MQRPTPEEIEVRDRFFEAPERQSSLLRRLKNLGAIARKSKPATEPENQAPTLSDKIRQATEEARKEES